MKKLWMTLLAAAAFSAAAAHDLLVEAESFSHKGGWVVDQQFMDLMGSPYLMAHGMGKAVAAATTEVEFPEKGTYYAYVRTYNWTAPWYLHPLRRQQENILHTRRSRQHLDVAARRKGQH